MSELARICISVTEKQKTDLNKAASNLGAKFGVQVSASEIARRAIDAGMNELIRKGELTT